MNNFWLLYDRHPYRISFLFSVIAVVLFFFAGRDFTVRMLSEETDRFDVVDIDEIRFSKRQTSRDVNSDETDSTEPDSSRATGSGDEPVDLAFHPNIATPRLVSHINPRHPPEARDLEVEASVYAEIFLSSEGRVYRINIIGVRLNRTLAPELEKKLKSLFARNAVEKFSKARYTPPVVNGRQVPVKFEQLISFRLD